MARTPRTPTPERPAPPSPTPPRWRVVATAAARRLPDGSARVRCANDLGHAVELCFPRGMWEHAWQEGGRK